MPAMSVYIGGLGEGTQKEDLEREFGRFGNITNVWVARNPPGFAFIDFENDDDADKAITEMNGATINEYKIRVNASRGGIKRGQGRGRGYVGFHGGRGGSGARGGRDHSSDSGFRRGGGGGYDSGSGYRRGGRGGHDSGSGYRRGGRGGYDSGSGYRGNGDGRYDSGSGYRSRSPIRPRIQSPIQFDPLYRSGIDIDGIHYTYAPLLLFTGIFQSDDCTSLSDLVSEQDSTDSDEEHPF